MEEILINLINSTVFQTVIAGVFVFVGSQILQDYFLKPKQIYRDVVVKIDNQLKFYSNIITSPGTVEIPKEILKTCNETLRSLSCELEATYKRLYCRTSIENKKVAEAASKLIGLSNGVYWVGIGLRNNEDLDRIRDLLNIKKLNY